MRIRDCRQQQSLRMRIRDWWDLRRHHYDRMFERLDAIGGPDEPSARAGTREPRRPLRPTLSAAAALDLPDD